MNTITATELARGTRRILDMVSQRRMVVDIQRNHATVARIVPSAPTMTAAQALADLQPTLTPEEGQAWLRQARDQFSDTVVDPWA